MGRNSACQPGPSRARCVVRGWFLEVAAVFALQLVAGPVFGQEIHNAAENLHSGSIHGR